MALGVGLRIVDYLCSDSVHQPHIPIWIKGRNDQRSLEKHRLGLLGIVIVVTTRNGRCNSC